MLLYLALRGVDFTEVGHALRDADYRWLLPLVAIVLVSHWLRAWRWKILLEALPPEDAGAPVPSVSVKTAFYSVMIGYMVNYAAPRLGEVARSANLAKQEDLSFGSVFGTVVVERILDVLVLVAGLASVFFLLFDRLAIVQDLFITPIRDQLGVGPALGLLGLVLAVGVLVLLIFRQALRNEDSRIRTLWHERLRPVFDSFKDGLATLLRARRRLALVTSTVAMWICYLLMSYLPFVMLGMAHTYGISLLDAWSIMLLGAIGIAVPSPGGTGSFHYITIETLVHLFAVDQSAAATYAVVTHAAQLVLYVLVGSICIVLQGSSFGGIKEAAQAAQDDAQDDVHDNIQDDAATPPAQEPTHEHPRK